MNVLLWLLLVLCALCALYLFLIAPARTHPDDAALRGWLYAHRGLHDGNQTVPENSMAAFRLAVEAGYGLELDVQQTRDGRLVVYHDGNLRRVCGVDRKIRDLTYEELCAVPLPDGSRVPLFDEVLALVAGRAPMIVEVKQYGNPAANAARTFEALRAYRGPFCVESFHPLAVRYFRRNAPDIVRGQLAAGGKWNRRDTGFLTHIALKYLLVNALGRPHFVAYSVPNDRSLSIWLMKRFFRPLLAAWTIRSQALLDRAQKQYDYPIFERFTPQRRDG